MNTRGEELEVYDPELFAILAKYFSVPAYNPSLSCERQICIPGDYTCFTRRDAIHRVSTEAGKTGNKSIL
ncbi:MAG: hypothetical protein R3B93_00065 [Bacteroidia bacterium]